MNRKEILSRLTDIVKDVLDDEHIALTENMLIEEIAEWDSVAHMTIMALVESELGAEVTIEQIVSVKKIQDIVDLILI